MSSKQIKEITKNIPNSELNAAYDALMNSSLNETSDYEEVSMEELNEYIEGLECQAEDLRAQLAKANERVAIYKRGINKAIEAIEREDDSSAYDAISHLENALQLRKELE